MSTPEPEAEILVAVVDDNRISREQHAKLLDDQPGVTVVSAEATLRVTMLTEEHPDVVLVDAGATELPALRAAVTMRRELPDARVVLTDLSKDNEGVATYVKAGVAGFVLNEADADELVATVRTVADGEHVLPKTLTSPLFVQIAAEGVLLEDDEAPDALAATKVAVTLTFREQEVVALLGQGLSNKAIATRMLISRHTVKAHLRSAMEKTGLRTRVLLALNLKNKK